MKIIPLSEGSFTVDGTKKFVPFDPAKDNLKDRPAGSLLVEVQPFVVITEKDILLLDTGLGFTMPDGSEMPGLVREVVGESVTIDFNHPLAGQTLTFSVEIVQVS